MLKKHLKGVLEFPSEKVNRSNRVKYRCGSCSMQVWGKPDIKLLCGEIDCKQQALQPM